MKKLIYACAFGAFATASIVALFSPQAITWYFSPPADLVISCSASVEWGINAYRKCVLIGALAGVFIGGAFYYVVQRKKTLA